MGIDTIANFVWRPVASNAAARLPGSGPCAFRLWCTAGRRFELPWATVMNLLMVLARLIKLEFCR
jgi:hypothetical protein